MVFRFPLLLISIALCLLSLHNANAFNIRNWPKAQQQIRGFSWKNCGPASDPAQIKIVTVSPDPIKLPGNITIGTSFSLASATSTDISLVLKLEKKVAGFYIKVPCIDNVGSCTYGDICKEWADACPKYFEKYGIPCVCPIPANTYTVSDAVVPITQALPGIATGDYRITANLNSASAGEIACLEIEVSLSK